MCYNENKLENKTNILTSRENIKYKNKQGNKMNELFSDLSYEPYEKEADYGNTCAR